MPQFEVRAEHAAVQVFALDVMRMLSSGGSDSSLQVGKRCRESLTFDSVCLTLFVEAARPRQSADLLLFAVFYNATDTHSNSFITRRNKN